MCLNIKAWADTVCSSVESVFLGKTEVVHHILVAILCRGHVLIEDVPGVGKTVLARAIAGSIGAVFNRVQCTPDLLPVDIVGVNVFNPKSGEFYFREGPIHTNILLVDEINRATPRTQSALLEAMAENQISIDGKSIPLPEPFFLMATENPIEFEGTFPLPEAQKDRFFLSLGIGYPSRETEVDILKSHRRVKHPLIDIKQVTDASAISEMQEQIVSVYIDDDLVSYLLDIIERTREDHRFRLGSSPRGSLALYRGAQALASIDGREYVIPEDIKSLVVPVLSKRLIMSTDSQMKGLTVEQVLHDILNTIEVPILRQEA